MKVILTLRKNYKLFNKNEIKPDAHNQLEIMETKT